MHRKGRRRSWNCKQSLNLPCRVIRFRVIFLLSSSFSRAKIVGVKMYVDRDLSIRADNERFSRKMLGRARSCRNYSGNSNRYRGGNERRTATQWPVISSSHKQNARALFLWARQVAPNVALCESSDTWPVVDLLSDKLHVITACGRGGDDRDHPVISFARERAAILASDSEAFARAVQTRAQRHRDQSRDLSSREIRKGIRNDRSSWLLLSFGESSRSS
jgi:hypothetical protein